jgi:hypothetical protein
VSDEDWWASHSKADQVNSGGRKKKKGRKAVVVVGLVLRYVGGRLHC